MNPTNLKDYAALLQQVKERIRVAQYDALKAVNKELINLYWDIGKMIVERQEKEGWGKSVVERLSEDLQKEFAGLQGFSVQNLWRMRQFYLIYQNDEKLSPMVREIGWSQNLMIFMRCKDALEREFYIRMTKKYGWTKNILVLKIEGKSYESTLLNQTNFNQTIPDKIKNQAKLAVKDEYTLKESNKPIGVAEYKVVKNVPQNLKGELPTPEQIAILLQDT